METQSTLWCAGLPLVARLPLAEADRRKLQREERLLRVSGIFCLIFTPLAFLGYLLFIVEGRDANWSSALIFFGMIGLFGLVPLSIAIAWQNLRRAKDLRGDLREMIKLRFEGTLHDAPLDETLLILLRKRLLRNDAQPQWLEILPVSHRIWRANDRPARGWIVATWAETAEQPEVARTAAGWLEPIGVIGDFDMQQGRRELSAEEMDELRRYAKGLWRKPLLPALLLSLWCFPLLGYMAHTRHWPESGGFWFAVLIIVTIATDLRLLVNLARARRIGRDLAGGFVIILNARADEEKVAEDAAPGEEHLYEGLPHSGLLWTEDGRAVGWRKV